MTVGQIEYRWAFFKGSVHPAELKHLFQAAGIMQDSNMGECNYTTNNSTARITTQGKKTSFGGLEGTVFRAEIHHPDGFSDVSFVLSKKVVQKVIIEDLFGDSYTRFIPYS